MAYDPFIQQKQHQPSPQRHSQGLSFLPPLVVGRRTLLAAGPWPPRIWVVKNLLGVRGGRVFCLLLWQTLWVSKPLSVAKKYSLYRGLKPNFADEECSTTSAVFKTIEDFRSTRNSAAEWSTNCLTVSTCKMSRAELKWNQCISLLDLWIRRQLIFFFVRYFDC